MVTRRGESSTGCLVGLLVVSAVIYFGVNIGEIYWRYYQFRDDVRVMARFGLALHGQADHRDAHGAGGLARPSLTTPPTS